MAATTETAGGAPRPGNDGDELAGAYERARSAFEYFVSESAAFMENAGGSQVPRCVVRAMSDYMAHHTAQLGAGYPRSARATAVVSAAHEWLEVLMNTQGQGKVVIGPSTSQLAFNLADAYTDALRPGDEIEASHESVLGPWLRSARRSGCSVRWWQADRASGASSPAELAALLGPATRMVVVTHVSNLLGEVLDLAEVVRLVRGRAPRAHVLADGVAFAPHRAMDVAAWGVDWYVWSSYKVYGPHVAVLYGRHDAYAALLATGGAGPNHYFVDPADLTYKFELGGACHEACAGLLALQDYLLHLLGRNPDPALKQAELESEPQSLVDTTSRRAATAIPAAPSSGRIDRPSVEAAFALMTVMEQPLQERLLSYLSSHHAVRLMGSAAAEAAGRVPTISFVHRRKSSAVLATELQAAGFLVRCGHMYARRLVEALVEEGGALAADAAARQAARDGAAATASNTAADGGGAAGSGAPFDVRRAVDEGVVRISLVHYNTPAEVAALLAALDRLL
ncbi:hypothetical protein GPECTOR_228g507 [Gonium pectorale]|uniref:Aminotransferase class V domain-containing protein n=1 Tax=Gonium pectorale TaxID=33097 RepID=A0A150FY96_GONPE|nr:hypothetical protein GPECTOR_228g507 [Gonium pectorale]|eukprot:KXZ41990.1 hypothetical protein GPECTOR_228g507 [Gonium pectorale]